MKASSWTSRSARPSNTSATKGEISSPISASTATRLGAMAEAAGYVSNATAARAPAGSGSDGRRQKSRRQTDARLPGLLRILRLDVPLRAALLGPGSRPPTLAEAIGGESQQHYAQTPRTPGCAASTSNGSRPASKNRATGHSRWMRPRTFCGSTWQCPSKGFLLANDLQADEDYCDHCMGWTIPLRQRGGRGGHRARAQSLRPVLGHDAQESGPTQPLEVEGDIRQDRRMEPRLSAPLAKWSAAAVAAVGKPVDDPCDVLAAWFAKADGLTILGPESAAPAVRREVLTGSAGADDRQNLRRRRAMSRGAVGRVARQ